MSSRKLALTQKVDQDLMKLMRARGYQIAVCGLVIFLIGCAGGGGGTPAPIPRSPTSISTTFVNDLPVAVAVQTGTGPFVPVTLQGNQLNFIVPAGVTKYAVAWACPGQQIRQEVVMEATTQDSMPSILGSCGGGTQPARGGMNGSVDTSAVPGATGGIDIAGSLGGTLLANVTSGSFNFPTLIGPNDIAVTALDSGNNPVAVKILRNQIVPGAANGGNTITLGLGDLVSTQPVTFTNVPAGFTPLNTSATYQTSGFTQIFLSHSASTQYPAIPAAAMQSGDRYLFLTTTTDVATQTSGIFVAQTSTSGAPVTIALPDPWFYSGPVPAAFPTFTFNYSRFSSLPVAVYNVQLDWGLGQPEVPGGTSLFLYVQATKAYLNGSNTITVPDLTAIPGFFASPPSGNGVEWGASIQAGPGPEDQFAPSLPNNSAIVQVTTSGSYTEP